MTATLKELLTEYAEQARPYDVREQALRRGRRRRRLRVAVPAALAALSVFATSLTLVSLGSHVTPPPAPPPQSQAVDPSPPQYDWPTVPTLPPVAIEELERISVPGYPAEIVTDPGARPLPDDQAAGRGLYLYTNPAGPWYGLVTESGAQYRLDLGDGISHDVSPGGRWLVTHSPASSTLTLRDLTDVAVGSLPVPSTRVLARWWSADDRWLLTAAQPETARPGAPPSPTTATRVDLSEAPLVTTQEIDLLLWPGFVPAAILTDGTVVLRPAGGDRLGDVVLVDPDRGDARAVSIDLSGAATPDELAATVYMENLYGLGGTPFPLRPLPDGSVLLQLWRSYGGSPDTGTTVATDVLVLDLDAGVVRERWRLPEPRPIPDNPRGDWESWRVEAVLPEGLLLAHRSTQRLWAWELYDPESGALSLVTDLRGLASAKEDE